MTLEVFNPNYLYEPMRGLSLWGKEEEEAAIEVLTSRSLFRYYGPAHLSRVEKFETAFAEHVGTPYSTAVSSGTAALTCALIGMGIPPGAQVIVPAATFVGCVNAVVAARGIPVFAEIDESLTMHPTEWESLITERTFAVMPVHLSNAAADLDPILSIASRHGLRVLEDAAQACGIRYHGRRCGSIGDAGAFSFQLEKNITAGEGGAVTTANPEIADRVVRYQDQGGQFATSFHSERGGGGGADFIGTNLRMTEIAGAILAAQLAKLDSMLLRLRDVARTVRAELSDLELDWRHLPDEEGSGGDLTVLLASRLAARRFSTALSEQGIPAGTMYQGSTVQQNPAVRAGRTAWGTEWAPPSRLRKSEALLGRSVTIRLGAQMTDSDTERLIAAVRTSALSVGTGDSHG